MKKIKMILCIIFSLCLLLPFTGCNGNGRVRDKLFLEYFNTESAVYSYAGDSESEFEENCRQIEAMLQKYHRLFDIYNEYEGINNLCTLNKNAGGDAIVLEEELVDFLLYAKDLYHITNGEMNVMMGSVLSLWHDCRELASNKAEGGEIPSHSALEAAAQHISIDLLEIDANSGKARISDAEASIDVGAIGKGYAAKMIADHLEANGISGYVIDLGGNLRLIGEKSDGNGWITAVQSPFNSSEYVERLLLKDTSCVTSGDYERYFEVGGKRYHHIIDKDTLYPSEYFSSVAVISRDSALADALTTALFCMTLEEGRDIVDSLEGVEAIWITTDGAKHCSGGIDEMRAQK